MASLLESAARACLREAGLRDSTLVAAVSGGPDSTALLHCLTALRRELGLEIHVAHLDHGLRGAQAVADARYVRRMAQRLGLSCTTGRVDLTTERLPGESLEQGARRLRYRFLAGVATSRRARAVALGHTANDQAESLLLHLARGAGLDGLAAMRPVDRWPFPEQGHELKVIRPLLGISRADVEAYGRERNLRPRRDASNESLAFRRNIVRHRVLPALAAVNPDAVAAVARAAGLLRADADFLSEQAERAYRQAVREQAWGLELDRGTLGALPDALRGRVFHRALLQATGAEAPLRLVSAVAQLCAGAAGTQLSLPGGTIAYADYNVLLLGKAAALPCPLPVLNGNTALQMPGETRLGGWRCLTTREPCSQPSQGGPWTAQLDAERVGACLTLRGRQPGDRFQPLGLDRTKKLQDFFVDAKVPRRWRDRVPLLETSAGIAWVAGYRIAHWARVTPATRRALRLELTRV